MGDHVTFDLMLEGKELCRVCGCPVLPRVGEFISPRVSGLSCDLVVRDVRYYIRDDEPGLCDGWSAVYGLQVIAERLSADMKED